MLLPQLGVHAGRIGCNISASPSLFPQSLRSCPDFRSGSDARRDRGEEADWFFFAFCSPPPPPCSVQEGIWV